MKLFIFFLFSCVIVSLALHKQSKAVSVMALLGLSAFVVFGYYFLNQI